MIWVNIGCYIGAIVCVVELYRLECEWQRRAAKMRKMIEALCCSFDRLLDELDELELRRPRR